MKRTYKKTLALTLVLMLLIQLCPIPIVTAASLPPYWNISDIPYSNKFVDLHQVSEGYVALDNAGDLWAWGKNTNGIFGNGTTTGTRELPQKISINAKFKQLSVGDKYWIALDTNGNIWGCGYQGSAELGNGLEFNHTQTTNDYIVSTPIQITSGTKFIKSIATFCNVLALDDKGNIWGWGANRDGTLISEGKGDYFYGSDYYINRPKQLTSGKKYKDIEADGVNVGAIDESNNLYMWGSNQYCQLAANSTEYRYVIQGTSDTYGCYGSYNPVQIKNGMKFSKVSMANWGVVALDTAGLEWRWGLVTDIGMSESSASKLPGYDSTARALYEPYNNSTTKFVDVYCAGSAAIYLKAADNQDSISNKIFVTGNNKDYYGNTEDEYGNKFGGWIDQLNGFTIIGPGLALDENGYMWRWGFEYINSEGERVKAEEPIQITGEKFTVTFKDGNTVLKTQEVTAGGSATAPENPTKTGYTFAGWDKTFTNVTSDLTVNAKWTANTNTAYKVEYYYQQDDGTYPQTATTSTNKTGTTASTVEATQNDKTPTQVEGKTYVFDSTNSNNVLTATVAGDRRTVLKIYFKQQYTITYKPGTMGTFIEQIKTGNDYNADTPTFEGTPTGKTGYTFAGWSPKVANKVTKNAEYTALWTANANTAYKVEHYKQNLQGTYDRVEEDTENLTGRTGDTVNAIAKTYQGYTENKTHENRVARGKIAGDGSLVLKLYYDVNEYTVTFKDGDTILKTETVKHGEAATAPEALTKTGYTFKGWDKAFNNVTTDIEVKATWEANEYNVTLNTNGGAIAQGAELTKYIYGVGATLPTAITKAGYIFVGWYNNNEFTGAAITEIGTGEIGDKEYYAKWTANGNTVYKVEHYKENLETNTYDKVESDTENLTGTTGEVVNATPKAYEGYTENITHENRVASGEIAGDGSLVLKLYYDVNEYTVTFKNENTVLKTETVKHGHTATAPEAPTKVGHTFKGWDKTFNNIISNLQVNAKWKANEYNVTLNPNGGAIAQGTELTKYTYGVGATLPSNVTKIGYTFDGWYNNENLTGDKITTIGTTETGDKEYYAKWTANTNTEYKVEHYKQNLETNTYDKVDTENLTGTTGQVVNATPKTYEGYTENITHEDRVASGEIKPDGSLVLKLYYDVNQYTVIFKDGDTILKTETVKHGDTATQPTLSKEGYTLSWDKSFINVTSDLEVNAIWTAGTGTAYTVEYYKQNTKLNGYDLVTEDIKHLTGTTGAIATVIGKNYEGFTENKTHPDRIASGEIKPDGSLVLKLYYDRNTYKVDLDTNGGTIKKEDEIKDYTYGVEEKLPIPEKEGYEFEGWYDNSEFTGDKIGAIKEQTLGDKQYYAKWKVNQYTVTFINDGKTVKTETVSYGGKATAPTLTRSGYILSWDKDFSNVKSDLEVKAVWTENKDTDTTAGGKLPQTGENYIIIGVVSVLISIAAFIYLKFNKMKNM